MRRDLDGAIVISEDRCVLEPTPDIFAEAVAATFPEPEGAENSAYLPEVITQGRLARHRKHRLTKEAIDLYEPLAWKRRRF